MKKITLFLAITLAGSSAFAQSERLVLFEEFTQASCPPCASTNPSLNAMLNAHPNEVVSIKYQTDWPGSDVMNVHNPAQVDTRVAYYSVTGVPGGELDGGVGSVSYTHLRAHETVLDLVCRLLLEKKQQTDDFKYLCHSHTSKSKN